MGISLPVRHLSLPVYPLIYALELSSDGTIRWESPELMGGQNQITHESDVYAYAILCIEILSMGRLPWPLMDDDAVQHFVLSILFHPHPLILSS